jgi:DNA-binding MarR family transcriptional regulator
LTDIRVSEIVALRNDIYPEFMNRKTPPLEAQDPEGLLLPVPGLRYGVLDQLLGYALRRAQNALYLDFYRAVAAQGESALSPQRFAALVLVAENPGMRQGLLAQAMGLHRSGALRLTDWLTAQGWVERRDDPQDARRWGLHLTPAGRRRLAPLQRAVLAHDRALQQGLGPADGAGLKTGLERLAWVATAAAQPLPLPDKKNP